jgi:methionyl-tRNA formyltransferase
MSKVRILFMGTPEFACTALEALLGDSHFEVVAVVTQPDRPAGRKMQLTPSAVKTLALKRGLKVLTPETVNTIEFRNEISDLKIESAVVVAFGQLLGDEFLALFPMKSVNVHGSLLPKWRGAAPIQRSLLAGDTETGVALQIVVKKLDAGPVLGVRRLKLTDENKASDVYPTLAKLGAELLTVEYMDYLRGNLTPIDQDENEVTIAKKIKKSESAIDWKKSAREILNLTRGLALGPIPHARRADGSTFKIHTTSIVDEGRNGVPGTVRIASGAGIEVQCGHGVIRLTELQPESRARMAANDYLKGYPMKSGEILKDGAIA